MKLENLKVTITRIEKSIDKEGYAFLKCKGFNAYKFDYKGKKVNGYNVCIQEMKNKWKQQ